MVSVVCLDLAGVLYDGNKAVPGAPQAVARLRAAGLALRFLTNTTRQPRRAIFERLSQLGFALKDEELFTPARAALERLRAGGYAPHLLIHPDLAEDFAKAPAQGKPAVVVGDAGPYFTYERLNAAFRVLDRGAAYFALAANRVFRDSDGLRSMDAGAFVAALEYAAGRRAEVLGKPAAGYFEAALAGTGAAPAEAVMVGDDAEADVAGALAAGFGAGVLVQTGKYASGDEDKAAPPPSFVAANITAAADWILNR